MSFFEGNKMTAGYGKGPDIINSCTIKVDQGEIVAILGNSMGWYSALAMSGSISFIDGNDLIYNMSTLMDENTIGGQIIYPIVDDNWHLDTSIYNDIVKKILEYLENEIKSGTKVNQVMRHTVGLYYGQPGSKEWKKYLSDNMMARDSDFQKAKHIMSIAQNNEKANQLTI